MTLVCDETDPITPTLVEHHVDEIVDACGRREQVYNYIDYHFERNDAYVWARAYLDKPSVVSIYGPFRGRNAIERVEAVDLLDAAKAYLQRRFNRVRTGAHP